MYVSSDETGQETEDMANKLLEVINAQLPQHTSRPKQLVLMKALELLSKSEGNTHD